MNLDDYDIVIQPLRNTTTSIENVIKNAKNAKKAQRKLRELVKSGGNFITNNFEISASDLVSIPFLVEDCEDESLKIQFVDVRMVHCFPTCSSELKECAAVDKSIFQINNCSLPTNNAYRSKNTEVVIEVKDEPTVTEFIEPISTTNKKKTKEGTDGDNSIKENQCEAIIDPKEIESLPNTNLEKSSKKRKKSNIGNIEEANISSKTLEEKKSKKKRHSENHINENTVKNPEIKEANVSYIVDKTLSKKKRHSENLVSENTNKKPEIKEANVSNIVYENHSKKKKHSDNHEVEKTDKKSSKHDRKSGNQADVTEGVNGEDSTFATPVVDKKRKSKKLHIKAEPMAVDLNASSKLTASESPKKNKKRRHSNVGETDANISSKIKKAKVEKI